MAGKSPPRATVAKARKRLPLVVWQKITTWICQQVQQCSASMDKWRSHRVVLVDGTCLTLPNEPELRRDFPPPKGYHGYGKYPPARMVCLSLAKTMAVISYSIGKYKQDETTLLKPMLKTLQKGDLLVADRHFAGANLFFSYMANGLEYLTRVHQKLKISRLKRLWSYSADDFVAGLKIGALYRRQNPELPKYITARFIRVTACIRGKRRDIRLVSSLLDAREYPADEMAQLYLQRWRIETLFKQFKVNTSAYQLRSKSSDAIHKEIAGWLVPERPGRLEPRRLSHDPKHYPRLRITRAQWRKQYVA